MTEYRNEPSASVWLGHHFEDLVHRCLPRGGKYKFRRLGAGLEVGLKELELSKVEVVRYESGELKTVLRDGVYALPKNKHQKGFDAVYWKGDTIFLLDITISKTDHPINGPGCIDALEDISEFSAQRVQFCFVVMDEVFANFKLQRYIETKKKKYKEGKLPSVLKNLEQFCLCFDVLKS